jgi:SAM-dependent methyltransferase
VSIPGDRPLHRDRERAGSFGDDAEKYDRVRPTYPVALIDALLVGDPSDVLDVGCGTGLTTRLFMARGCDVLGIEPDTRMAAVARRRGGVVEDGTFEDWDPKQRRFDLLVAGQAWHWVDPWAGARKAGEVLRPGGRIGLFWNQSFPGPEARRAMDGVYRRLSPQLGANSVLIGERDVSLYEGVAQSFRETDQFVGVGIQRFGHDANYSTEQWLELASTHSDHHTLPSEELRDLISALRTALEGAGGFVPVRYETTLVTGQVRSG